MEGFHFPVLDTPAMITCWLANKGNIEWRAVLTIIGGKRDGQGKPVKVAKLRGKDSYAVLCSTAQPILNKGFSFLQDSTRLVI